MATRGELVSTHMPKKSPVKNCGSKIGYIHECQLLASVTLHCTSSSCMLQKTKQTSRLEIINLAMIQVIKLVKQETWDYRGYSIALWENSYFGITYNKIS